MTENMFMFIFILFTSICVDGCYLWGTDSGYCEPLGLDSNWRSLNMPFCGNAVDYPVCVPKPEYLPPSSAFPPGRWSNHTILTKDQWVQKSCSDHISKREKLENDKNLQHDGVNEYGDAGRIKKRFTQPGSPGQDCKNAFTNYFCWINFPRCDPVTDLTKPTCRSACENFFISCNYETNLKRCGKSKWFNGYFPEGADGNCPGANCSIYFRDYFPGQPFRTNKFEKITGPRAPGQKGPEIPICTPAISGKANKLIISYNFIIFIVTTIIATLFILK